MEPITLRWVERLIIDGGGIFFGYLGYKLFLFGVEKGSAKVSTKSKIVDVVFSGTAPGLFFMAAGCAILVISLFMRLDPSPGGGYLVSPHESSDESGISKLLGGTNSGFRVIVIGPYPETLLRLAPSTTNATERNVAPTGGTLDQTGTNRSENRVP